MKVLVFSMALILLIIPAFAITNFNACTNMSIANEVYNMTASFTATTTECLNVTADNVTIEGNNFVLTNNGFAEEVDCTGTNTYTVQNLGSARYTNNFFICGASNFTNTTVGDISTGSVVNVFGGSDAVVLVNNMTVKNGTLTSTSLAHLTLFNLTSVNNVLVNNLLVENISSATSSAASATKLVSVFGIASVTVNTSLTGNNITLTNIKFNNVSLRHTGDGTRTTDVIGLFETVSTDALANRALTFLFNSIIANITISNSTTANTLNGATFHIADINIIGASRTGSTVDSNPITNVTCENVNITNVTFNTNNISLSASGGQLAVLNIIVSAAKSTALGTNIANNTITNTTIQNITFKNNTVSVVTPNSIVLSDIAYIGSYIIGNSNTGFNSFVNITNSSIEHNFASNLSPVSICSSLASSSGAGATHTCYLDNTSLTTIYTSNLSSQSQFNLANFLATIQGPQNQTSFFKIRDIPTIPANPASATNVSYWLNYSFSSTSDNTDDLRLFYIPIGGLYDENQINLWNYTGSAWNKLTGVGTLNIAGNYFDANLTALLTTEAIGLFNDNPSTNLNITLNSPANASSFNVSSVTFNWTVYGDFASYLSNLTIDGTTNVSNIASNNNTAVTQAVNGIPDGTHNWSITSWNGTTTNTSGNQTFTIETIAPNIVLNSPTNNLVTNQTSITFNFTPTSEFALPLSCSEILDGSTNVTNSSIPSGTSAAFTIPGLVEGTHTWYINCSDGVISGNSLTRNFTVDTTAPIISLNSPANNYYQFNNQSVLFNFTATDNIATTLNCSLYLDAVLNTTNASTQNGTATTFNVNGISYATHNWSVSCLDSASNTGTSATNNFTLVNIYFITATLANNSNTTANPIQLNLTATSNQTSNCVFGINGINSTGTVIGTYCFLNFTNLTHNTTYNITGYANFSGNIGATNETRVINWYNQSLCTLLDNIYNLTQNQSIRSTVGDSQMAVIATISLNNTCPVNIVNLNYKLNDGVANGTASTYLINITANSQANFSNYGYYIPISFTESSQGSVPIGAYGNNELYILNTTYGRNISSIIISVGSLGNPVSLYDCEVAPCSLSNNSAWSLLSPSISGSSLFGSAGYLSSTLSFLQSYQVSGGGGGGGGGGFVIPTNQTPPAAAPENVTGQQTIAPDIQDNAKCLALGAGLLVLLFIFNRGKKQ